MEDATVKPNEVKKKEMKIPVLSVLKKGGVLKNIFLNSRPPPPPESSSPSNSGEDPNVSTYQEEETEEPIIIGRHPDCHIVLDHPSISRFHLEVRTKPISQKLSVVDLSSVHGTWVSGNKIEPGILVDVVEGDTLRLGASTRVYQLYWVSLNRVFEMENPLGALLEENEEIHQEDSHELSDWDQKGTKEIPSAPPLPEFMHSSSPCEFLSSKLEMVEKGSSTTISSLLVPTMVSASAQLVIDGQNGIQEDLPDTDIPKEKEYHSPPRSESWVNSSSLLSRRNKSVGFLQIPSASGRENQRIGCMKLDAGVEAVEFNEDNNVDFELAKTDETIQKVLFGDSDVIEVETDGYDEEIFVSAKENIALESPFDQGYRKNYSELHIPSPDTMAIFDVKEAFYSDKENWTPESSRVSKSRRCIFRQKKDRGVESTDASDQENLTPGFSLLRALDTNLIQLHNVGEYEAISDGENWTPEAHKVVKLKESVSENSAKNERQGDTFASDKENLTPDISISQRTKKGLLRPCLKAFSAEDDICCSDKENWTPKVPREQRLKKSTSGSCRKNGRDEDSFASDKENLTVFISGSRKSKNPLSESCAKLERYASDKENLTPYMSGSHKSKNPLSESCAKLERGIMEKRVERIPFQLLSENSPMRNTKSVDLDQKRMADNGEIDSTVLDSDLNNYMGTKLDANMSTMNQAVEQALLHKVGEEKKKWNMVVDTSCFLDEESKSSLQLLEGLKGTHLTIPRMVIRELDCLKRRENWFRRTSKVSSALQWIEECMVKTSWWIHVQSSLEMTPVAPTPPTTPRSPLDEGTNELVSAVANSMPFSICGSLSEILSPTAEDHILDCALLFKRTKTDGQLVLLTNNITLKIKAMAEGLLCETPKEFRESLINPCSKRFLWVDSSPRGSTWSFSDEMGLMDDYYYQVPQAKRTTRAVEVAKGLKLILLHNSLYRQTYGVK